MTDLPRRAAVLCAAALICTAATDVNAWSFAFPSIEEGRLDFSSLKDRVLLVVNTASFCGFTYQYEALEKLHASLEPKGLTVIGMPSQDFGQESGTDGAVKAFCEATFGVQFPMTGLLHVKGPQANDFHRWVRAQRNWEPTWNFNKVLIGRDGTIRSLYRSEDEPTGSKLTRAIDDALKA